MHSWVRKEKSYTPKYRAEAARLVIDTGRTIVEVVREIGVGEALLGRWVAIERSRMGDPPEALDADERAEAAVQCLDTAGVQSAAMLGLSWGGFVALRVALAAPQRVRADMP